MEGKSAETCSGYHVKVKTLFPFLKSHTHPKFHISKQFKLTAVVGYFSSFIQPDASNFIILERFGGLKSFIC